ncbi:MAG: coiled-coil [candidate division WS6 bacterium 34_10]|uniref:Coiled-coil n=1 Tax=candidate division WS6 bacterium 34_10 TaxID=1641389 RepID=A0A101HJ99_9BACT|nr:MAG: coiled-coil [candidate division WS6 bacterium 34_10]
MTARRRKRNKNSKKVNIPVKKYLPYILIFLVVAFLIYRVVLLLSFKVDSTQIPKENLSTDSSMVNSLFVFEQDEKIVYMESITYSSSQNNILRIPIPTDIYVTEDEVDSYPISSMRAVGEFLDYNFGRNYTVEYMSNLLGLKYDNYVWIVDSGNNTDEFLSELSVWSILFNLQFSHNLRNNVYSNLPILNLIKEVNFINQSLSSFESEQMNIVECCVEEVTLSSDRVRRQFNTANFDKELSKYISGLVSREVERERVNVEVYNGSNITGLASEYARIVRHTGARILRYDNAPHLYEETVIYVPEPENYQNSLILIRDVVGNNVKVKNERPQFVTTGDIVLVLGEDISN